MAAFKMTLKKDEITNSVTDNLIYSHVYRNITTTELIDEIKKNTRAISSLQIKKYLNDIITSPIPACLSEQEVKEIEEFLRGG